MSDEQVRQKRLAILDLAKRLASDGAYYLWSAGGETPNDGGVVTLKAPVLDPANPQTTTFCAATVMVDKVEYVCSGRFRAPGLPAVPLPAVDRVAWLKDAPVNPDSPSIKALLKFIDQNKANPYRQDKWGFELTPRAVLGEKFNDYGAGGKDITGSVVWGEGCQGVQHFDCGGFVRYVVKTVCGYNITGLTNGAVAAIQSNTKDVKAWGAPVGTLVAEGEAMEPADILIYPGHIAFAIAGIGVTYRKAAPYPVAQADCACFGVNYGVTHHQTSTACVRLSSRVLIGL